MGSSVPTVERSIQFRIPLAREMLLRVSFGKSLIGKHPVLGYLTRRSAVQRNRILIRQSLSRRLNNSISMSHLHFYMYSFNGYSDSDIFKLSEDDDHSYTYAV